MSSEVAKDMVFENPMRDLSKNTKLTYQQVLNNLLEGKNNLELKTHIFKPKALAGLKSIAQYLETIGLPISSKLILDYIQTYLEYMVSYKRLSRKEVIQALTLSNRDENTDNSFITKLD